MDTRQKSKTREQIELAILGFAPSVTLEQPATLEDVKGIIRIFMRNHPEIFWFSHQYHYENRTRILQLRYNFTKEKAKFFKAEIEKVITDDFQADYVRTLRELEKLVYVYKWIAKRTTYNEYSSFNQTIYSVLVNRNSVCTGYAKTAQYLLNLVGIESELVFGKFHSDRSEHGRHGWNIVKIGETWYHVDFCLTDISLSRLLNKDESLEENDSIMYNYFGVSTDKILGNRSIEFIETLPDCADTLTAYPNVELLKPKKKLICCKSNSGTSSKVYLDSYNKNRVIKVSRNGQTELLRNEAITLAKLSGCPHIIKSYGLNEMGLSLEQLTPWSELLNSHYYNPTESVLKNIIRQLIEGLIVCRDKGISYSDIHYNNVFVTKDGTYKWGDFGIAFPCQFDDKLPSEMIGEEGETKGSYWFIAPETYHQKVFTEASVIYSIAMMAYFVMNDMRPPFWTDEEHQQEALAQRLNGQDIHMPIFAVRYMDLWSIIRRALSYSTESRPCSFEDFINQLDSDAVIIKDNPIVELECCPTYMEDNDCPILIDIYNDGGIDDSFATTEYIPPQNYSPVEDTEKFASTMGGRWGDGGIHDSDSFACTAAYPGNSIKRQPEQTSSYQPQPKSPKVITKRKSLSIFKAWSSYWRSADELSKYSYETELDYGDEISACVYAPAQIQPMKTFIVRVYLYKPEESEAVIAKVCDIAPNAQKKEYKPLDIPVKEGDKLTVQLKMSGGIKLDTEEKSIIWRNHFTDCSFMAKLTELSIDDVFGTAYVSVNGIPAGELLFTIDIDIVKQEEKTLYAKVESRRYSRIFISYSHVDEAQVRGFAECCRALGTDYFFDRHTLQAGDLFKNKILNYINNADLFVLCWSKNAAVSEWVQIERKHALSIIRNGKTSLSIYPLSLKPEAPLPSDMSDKYNFGIL